MNKFRHVIMNKIDRIELENRRHERELKSIEAFWDFLDRTGADIDSDEPFKLPGSDEYVLWTIFDYQNLVIQYQKLKVLPGDDGFGEFRADEI